MDPVPIQHLTFERSTQAKASEHDRDVMEAKSEIETLQNMVKRLEEELQKANAEVIMFPYPSGFCSLLPA